MDNKNNSGHENVNKTLLKWALESSLLKIAFRIKDVKDIDNLLKTFFSNDNEKQKESAGLKLYKKLWGAHPQFGPYPPIELLKDFEYRGGFYDKYREHAIVHPLYVCFLGLYIYEYNCTIRNYFAKFIEKEKIISTNPEGTKEREAFVSLWVLSSLYHDIGYLVENEKIKDEKSDLSKLLKDKINELLEAPLANTPSFSESPYCSESEKIEKSLEKKVRTELKINCKAFSVVDIENTKFFSMLQNASESSKIAITKKNGILEYYKFAKNCTTMSRPSFRDHGIVSALLLLFVWNSFKNYIGKLSGKTKVGKYYSNHFEKISELNGELKAFSPIIDAAARAISLHNIDKFIWNAEKEIDEKQNKTALLGKDLTLQLFCIPLETMPLAFLLKLCDELQNWDRPYFRFHKQQGLYNDDISIIASDRGIVLRFFKDEEQFLCPDTYEHSNYFELNELLKQYFNAKELNDLLGYEKYTVISNGSNFLRLFLDDTDKGQDYNKLLKQLGNLLSQGVSYNDNNISEKDKVDSNNKKDDMIPKMYDNKNIINGNDR